jgi:hypothetical protein
LVEKREKRLAFYKSEVERIKNTKIPRKRFGGQ